MSVDDYVLFLIIEDQELRMKCRQKAKENDKKNRIIIGNSSSQTNNHFEIFEMMSAKNWKDYEIYFKESSHAKISSIV